MLTTLTSLCHRKSSRYACPNTIPRLCLCHDLHYIPTLPYPVQRHPPASSYFTPLKLQQLDCVLQKCSDSGHFHNALSVHTLLLKIDSNGFVSLWNKLLRFYCKCGQFQFACKTFDKMPKRDVVSFNTMISACVGSSYGLQAVSIYKRMVTEDYKPNHITLAGMIGACAESAASRLRDGFHAVAILYNLNCNEYVGCSLVDGYAEKMRLEDALKAFNEIAVPDLVSWNIMIDGCVRNNNKENVFTLFAQMLQEIKEFDGFTLTSMIKVCLESRDFFLGKLLHCCGIKTGLNYDTPLSNALITMYSRCEGRTESSLKIFGETLAPNIISWTAMITGFMQCEQNEEAIAFYKNMLRSGVKENDFSFTSILSVYGNLASLDHGRQIHARIVKSCFGLDLFVNNALIDTYSKCGSLADAHIVFRTMEKHDKVSCTTMITALGHHGKGRKALGILKEMEKKGLKPDDVTLLVCLSACSHSGDVDNGIWVFKLMINDYDLKPRREHFSCVVDMLGRAGRLFEAERFIEEMGIGSDVFVWETLLGACRLHGVMDLGEKSVKKIMELQQSKHGSYVLLANMYADKGLWEDKGAVLENLNANGLKKEAGCSWVSSQSSFR